MVKSEIDPTFHLIKKGHENQTLEYSKYRNKWNENPKKYIVGDFPIHLDFESTTACNLKCFMCFQSYDAPKHLSMDIEIFKNVIDEGVKMGLCSIKLQYRGEPLLYPNIVEMVKYAKKQGIIEVMFNTNATLLTEEKSRDFIEAGLDKIICSVDGCNEEIYENVRIGAKFTNVLENIKNMQRLKKETGSARPVVRVQMVDTPRNHHQIDQYIKFWGKIADHVAIEDMLDWDMAEENYTPLEDFACAQLWQRLIILADGDVLPCCRAMRGGNEKLEVVGNINENTISDIWGGEKLTRFRELHKNGESHKMRLCRLCGLRKSLIEKKDIGEMPYNV